MGHALPSYQWLSQIASTPSALRRAHPDQSERIDNVLRHVAAFIREHDYEDDDGERIRSRWTAGGWIGAKPAIEEPPEPVMGSELSGIPIITNERNS